MRLIRLEKATKEQGRENSLRSLEFVRRSAGFVSKLQSKTLSSGQWYFRLFYSSCITSFVLLLFQGSLSSRAMESALCRLSSFSFGYARTCTVPVCTCFAHAASNHAKKGGSICRFGDSMEIFGKFARPDNLHNAISGCFLDHLDSSILMTSFY